MSAPFFVSRATCFAIARDVIHDVTNYPLTKMRFSDTLTGTYRIPKTSLGGLAAHVNDRIKPWGGAVAPAEIIACKTMGDLVELIEGKLR